MFLSRDCLMRLSRFLDRFVYKNPKRKERGGNCHYIATKPLAIITISNQIFWIVLLLLVYLVSVFSDHRGSLMQPKTSSSKLAEEPGKSERIDRKSIFPI